MKSGQTHNIGKQQIGFIHPNQTSGSEIIAFKGWRLGGCHQQEISAIPYKSPRHGNLLTKNLREGRGVIFISPQLS